MIGPGFDIDALVEQCRDALTDAGPHAALKSVVEEAIRRGPALATSVPERIRDDREIYA